MLLHVRSPNTIILIQLLNPVWKHALQILTFMEIIINVLLNALLELMRRIRLVVVLVYVQMQAMLLPPPATKVGQMI